MEPSFGDLQTVVIAVFGALALALAAVFALVAPQTRRDVPFERVQRVGLLDP